MKYEIKLNDGSAKMLLLFFTLYLQPFNLLIISDEVTTFITSLIITII